MTLLLVSFLNSRKGDAGHGFSKITHMHTGIKKMKAMANPETKGPLKLVTVKLNQVHDEQKNIRYQIIIHHLKFSSNMSASLR